MRLKFFKIFTLILIVGVISSVFAKESEWEGKKAPDFNLTGLEGKKNYQLSQYRNKIVILDFWASWCAPCKKSLPELEQLAIKYMKDTQILAINIDDDKKNAISFLSANNIILDTPYDIKKEVVNLYNILAMPSLFIIDRKGIIRAEFGGYTVDSFEKIVEAIEEIR